jgi:hypothetical protein
MHPTKIKYTTSVMLNMDRLNFQGSVIKVYDIFYGSTALLLGLRLFFSLLISYTDGRTPWTGDQPVARPLPTHRTTQTQISMPLNEFEATISVFERAKTIHISDRAATVIGRI